MINICQINSAATANSAEDYVTGVGAVYINGDISQLRGATVDQAAMLANAVPLGVTDGGVDFSEEKETRVITWDGKKGNVKGDTVFESRTAKLTINFKQINIDNIRLMLTASDAKSLGNGLTEITPRACLSTTDYIDNVIVVTRHATRKYPIIIYIENALNTGNAQFQFQDRSELTPTLELTASYADNSMAVVPYGFFISDEAGFFGAVDDDTISMSLATAGTAVDINLTLAKFSGWDEPVTATLIDAPSGVTMAPVTVAAGSTTGTLSFMLAAGSTKTVKNAFIRLKGAKKLRQHIPVEISIVD